MALSMIASTSASVAPVKYLTQSHTGSHRQAGDGQKTVRLGGLGPVLRLAASKPRQVGASRARQLRVRADTQYFNAEDASKAVQEDGYIVVDIRDQAQYDRAHIQGSVHIPLFVENTDTDPGTLFKKQVHTAFVGVLYGLAFTKPNEAFLPAIEQKFDKDSKLLLVCQEGLRSGSAVVTLQDAGYQNLGLLTSGLQRVPPGTFPKEGPKELMEAGKAGFVTIQTQFSVVLATILIGAYLYLEYFPEESANLLKNFTPPS